MDDIWMQNGSNPNKILIIPSSQQQLSSSHPDSHWNMYSVLNPGQISGNFGRPTGNINHNNTTDSSYSQQTISSTSISTSSSSHHYHQHQHQNIQSSMITKRSESTSSINDTININTTTSTGTTVIATAIKNMIKMEDKSIDAAILVNSVCFNFIY
ncbi:unnamed protein product [Onchocerca flexuosa]|uniref:Uncharacterized protein n=1 Tax=Onchocerca flexuosa TaxID=387005 RepID=A0A183H3C4_9BILA|nr:unnamed protein product [Onchocerca flexuosa]